MRHLVTGTDACINLGIDKFRNMSDNIIIEKLRELIVQISRNNGIFSIDIGHPFIAEVGLTSMQIVKLIMKIEETFKIRFGTSAGDMESFGSLKELSRTIHAKAAEVH